MAIQFVRASSQRVSLGTSIALLQNVSAGTVAGWITPADLSTQSLIQFSVGTGNSPSRFTIEIETGNWICGARRLDADAITKVIGSAASSGVKMHFAGVCRFASGGLDFYINGVLYGTTANAGWTANSSNTASSIGHIGSEDDGLSNYCNAVIDDVRVYDRALVANEINTIYIARGCDNILAGLQHRWTMTEGTTGAAVSGAGSVRDKGLAPLLAGTATNSPTYAGEIAAHRRKRRAA